MDITDPATLPRGSRSANEPMPVGAWVRLFVPQQPDIIGFTYLDPQAGLSAKGGPADDPQLAETPTFTVRLPGLHWQPLIEEEIARRGLPARPTWVEEFFGPQPAPGSLYGWWRRHPKLRGRFHPRAPDDLQVLVHDGGPRLSKHRPELVWVRVTGGEGDVFTGTVLNQPHQLVTVRQGSSIRFLVPERGEHPLLVTEKYLRERPDWEVPPPIHPRGESGGNSGSSLSVDWPSRASLLGSPSTSCDPACVGRKVDLPTSRNGYRKSPLAALRGLF